MIMESIGFEDTAPSTGGTGVIFSGDSATIKNFDEGKRAWLLTVWGKRQTAGFSQLIAPSFSDTTRGLRGEVPAAQMGLWLPPSLDQEVQAQEVLASTISGSATAGDIEQDIVTLLYEDVPGLTMTGLTMDEVNRRAVRKAVVEATLSLGTGGGWSGSEALNAETDLLRANTDYAVLGASQRVLCSAVGIRAPDWSNVRLAVPGLLTNNTRAADWFVYLSEMTGLGLIPVFNSANKGAINLDGAQDENGADAVVSLNLVELT